MDTGTITFIIVMVLCIAIPIVIYDAKKNKKKNQSHRRLLDLAEKNSSTITEYDRWNNSEIGVDKESGILFFISTIEGKDVDNVINLAEIQKCKYVNSSRTINNKESYQVVVDKLALVFEYRDKSNHETTVEFYNSNYDSVVLNGEIQMTQKWNEIINNFVSTRK